MKKLFIAIIACVGTAATALAQSTTTNYYNQYGYSTGSSRTRTDIGGGSTTTYYDRNGYVTGTSRKR